MVNWYYVAGSERVGPVSEDALRDLYLKLDINAETYVWKKGFTNWERLKDVSELKFEEKSSTLDTLDKTLPTPMLNHAVAKQEKFTTEIKSTNEFIEEVEEDSPEIIFNFNWKTLRERDDLFYVKVGNDRKNFSGSEIFGPYSLVEMREAFSEKRIGLDTLIFAPGMGQWTKLSETPINPENSGITTHGGASKEIPLLLVFDYFPIPLVTLIKKTGGNEGLLLGAGPFWEFQGNDVKTTLYVGNKVKVKNIIVNVVDYNKKSQVLQCKFSKLSPEAKKIMQNHAVS